jgi:hypothetical protein
MPITIRIPDGDLRGFSGAARQSLQRAVTSYSGEVIEEANRIEAGRGSAGAAPEVTRGMVDDAVVVYRRGLGVPKRSIGVKFLRVAAPILSLFVGILWDTAKLQTGNYIFLFVIVLAAAIIAVTLSALKE